MLCKNINTLLSSLGFKLFQDSISSVKNQNDVSNKPRATNAKRNNAVFVFHEKSSIGYLRHQSLNLY